MAARALHYMQTLTRIGRLAWYKSSTERHPLHGYQQLPYIGMRFSEPRESAAELITQALNDTPLEIEWALDTSTKNWILAPCRLFSQIDELGEFHDAVHSITVNDQEFCEAALGDLDKIIDRLAQMVPPATD